MGRFPQAFARGFAANSNGWAVWRPGVLVRCAAGWCASIGRVRMGSAALSFTYRSFVPFSSPTSFPCHSHVSLRCMGWECYLVISSTSTPLNNNSSGKTLWKEFLDEMFSDARRHGFPTLRIFNLGRIFRTSGIRALMIAPSLVKRSVHVFLRTKGWDLKSE